MLQLFVAANIPAACWVGTTLAASWGWEVGTQARGWPSWPLHILTELKNVTILKWMFLCKIVSSEELVVVPVPRFL
jgi:hypothetical protein